MKRKRRSVAAFSLIEVALALAVAAFSFVTIFGLLPIGISSSQNAVEQTAAAGIAGSIEADLRATLLLASGTSPLFGFTIPAAGASSTSETIYLAAGGSPTSLVGGSPGTIGTGASRYRASLSFEPPGSGQKAATQVRMLITWPALANPQTCTGSFETLTALRNN